MSYQSRAQKVMRMALESETAIDLLGEADAEISVLRDSIADLQAAMTEQVERRDAEILRLKNELARLWDCMPRVAG